MVKQSKIFLQSEGDRYHERNLAKPREPDPVLQALHDEQLKPDVVLEIGCGDGWRLRSIRRELGSVCYGIEPSRRALAGAPHSIAQDGIECRHGTASSYRWVKSELVNLVLFAFCLYLVDRQDLFRVVAEADRVLHDGGHICIHDFFSSRPHARLYQHRQGLLSYKQDYAALWTGNPAYHMVRQRVFGAEGKRSRDDQCTVTLLRKSLATAWPVDSLEETE